MRARRNAKLRTSSSRTRTGQTLSRRIRPATRRSGLERLETRLLLAADWQNPGQSLDINADLFVAPSDVLVGVNRLNDVGSGPFGARPANSPLPYYDASGDGIHDPNDVLAVINALNAQTPRIAARLTNDTAPGAMTNRDWISSDPRLTVNVSPAAAETLRAGAADTLPEDFLDVTGTMQNGRFQLDIGTLESVFGGALADGSHTIQFQATDADGAESNVTRFRFMLDRTGPLPEIRLQDTERVAFDTFEVDFGERLAGDSFDVANYSLVVDGGPSDGQPVTIVSVAAGPGGREALIQLEGPLADRGYRFASGTNVYDVAGNQAEAGLLSFVVADPPGIAAISPTDGEQFVSVARETIVRFDEPIDPSTVTADSFYLVANGERIAGRIAVSSTERFATLFYDAPLPPSTEVHVVVDGDTIMGRDGLPLDANGDDEPGGRGTADFRTLPLTRIPGTNLFGFVRDSMSGEPIVGATIRVDAFPEANAVTDETGRFLLEDMPAPDFFVHVDGSTATNLPAGFSYPNVGKPFHSVPGQEVQLEMGGRTFDIFLPLMAMGDVQPLSSNAPTDIGFGNAGKATLETLFPDVDPAMFEMMKVTFEPGSARNDAGVLATEAIVIPVPTNRLPAPVPASMNPALVVSIQAGVNGTFGGSDAPTNFDIPAEVSFPNLDGMQPGEQVLVMSFDHDAGAWKVNGTATVSEDGMSVKSDPGTGILAPGWHFTISGSLPAITPNADLSDRAESSLLSIAACSLPPQVLLTPVALIAAEYVESKFEDFGSSLGVQHLNHFLDNSGAERRYGPGTTVSDLVLNSSEFKGQNMVIKQYVDQEVQRLIAAGDKGGSNIPIPDSVLQQAGGRLAFRSNADLFWGIHGTQGLEIQGSVDVDESGSSYSGTISYTYYDSYGFGVSDTWFGQNSISYDGKSANTLMRHLQICGFAHWFPVFVTVEVPISAAVRAGSGAGNGNFTVDSGGNSPSPSAAGETTSVSVEAGFGADPVIYYRYVLANGTEISGRGRLDQALGAVVVPPNTAYTATFYAPSINRSTQVFGVSTQSGSSFTFESLADGLTLVDFGGPDRDGDGLPDVGELAIGTSPDNSDTDGDGIFDSAEIAQGLDPLGGRVFPTGIVASLPLRGEAKGIVSVGDPENAEARTVYVATGSHGLAIVDTTRFDNPIVQGQIDLPGDNLAVAVDAVNQIALVAGTVGLHRVDISDPMQPVLIESIDLLGGAKAVEVFSRTAFVGNGNSVISFDTVNGERIDAQNLGVTEVRGLAREGSFLFAMQANGTLSSIDVSRWDMRRLDSLVLNGAGGQLFVGDGIAYAAGVATGQGGYLTADVSDPADLQFLADEGIPFGTVIPGQAIVANGAGVSALVGSGGGGNFLELMDSSDALSNFNRLGVSFPLPDAPLAVALGGGLAYIATGSAGLQVINMLPFDADGNPPTVGLVSPDDVDPNTAGVQVIEGFSIPVFADVEDDVQVRNVQLLIDGAVVANSLAFPWNLTIPPQSFVAGGNNQIVVQVRAADTGGNSALSEPVTLEITPDTIPPTITSQTPIDGSVRTLAFRTARIAFSELMDPETLIAANIRLVAVDGDATIAPDSFVVRDEGGGVQVIYPALTPGDYRLELQADALTDRAGNPLGDGVRISAFTVIDSQLPEIELVDIGPVILDRNDDSSTSSQDLGFQLDLFGQSFTSFHINNNGNVTFERSLSTYTAEGFPQGQPIIAPFWADVDTNGSGSGVVHLNSGINERGNAFVQVTWDRVGYYSSRTDKLNDFTLYIEDDPAGDIVAFIYREMQWTTGDASDGTDGFGGSPAQIGFDSGDGENFLSLLRPNTPEEVADLSNRDFVFRLTEEFLGEGAF